MRPRMLFHDRNADATPRLAQPPAPRTHGGADTQPHIVALGGGTGLPNVLRGLRPLLYGGGARGQRLAPRDRLVAVVATSDDGGSSGRLRAEFNMIPPGDIRNCLAALSDNHALIADIFQYRFESGEGLNGHAIGNLVLAALADVTNDFVRAVEIAARVVGACGRVLPATSELVTLMAEFTDGRVLTGETAIASAGGGIKRVSLIPDRPRCVPDTCEALENADVIVVGPGSLFTSILPPLLVPDVAQAMRTSDALRILVANLMTEPGETDDFSILEHVLTIERHVGAQLFDCVIYNTAPVPQHLGARYAALGAQAIATGQFELNAFEKLGINAFGVPLVSEHPSGKIRHHPDRLAVAIMALARGRQHAWRGRSEAGGA